MAFDDFMRALRDQGFWGPFLVLAGIVVFYFSANAFGLKEPRPIDYVVVAAGALLALAGVILMFKQQALDYAPISGGQSQEGQEDADYVVKQLSRNFEVLRAQTNQGFLFSGVFMAIGLLVICTSLFAPTLGIKTQGVDTLGVLAGVVTEFISGTALFLYRLNFSRLNQTSDRLDDAWRVLAAFKLTRELPDDKKAEATLQLISSLTQTQRKV